jgi:hypothetical protein
MIRVEQVDDFVCIDTLRRREDDNLVEAGHNLQELTEERARFHLYLRATTQFTAYNKVNKALQQSGIMQPDTVQQCIKI